MALNIAQLYLAIEPVVRKDFGLGRKKITPQFSKVAEVDTVDEPIREFYEIGGPGRLMPKTENQAIQLRSIQLGPVKRVQAATYAAGIEISAEAVKDVKVKAIKSSAQSLGRATDLTPEYLFATFLDRAHDTNYPITPDGKPLFSTSHLTPYGVTVSNTLTTPSALSETSMEDIKTQLRQMVGPDGMLSPVMLKQWVVPSALGHLIKKLTSSSQTLGSANNDPNINKGDSYQIMDYVTNQTRFFAQTDADNGFYWDWRESPTFERDNVALTRQAVFLAFFRAMWGAEDFRCAYSSNAT